MNLWTTEEACQELRISKTQLYRLVKSGDIPFLRIGKGLRFESREVLAHMRKCAQRAS